MNKGRRPVSFRSQRELYHADTCEPLTAAVARGELRLAALGRGSYPGQPLPARDLRELCSLGMWDARAAQDWGLGWHRNEGIELTYLAAGHLDFAVEDRTFTLAPGSFTITRPWQKHRVGDPHVTASRLIWLILDVGVRRPNQAWHWPAWMLLDSALLRRLTLKLRHNEQPVWKADRRLARCFEELAAHCGRPLSPAHSTQLKIVINELWIALAGLLTSRRMHLDESLSSTERTVRLFLDDLRSRSDEPWTLDTMAEQCGIGRSCLSQYCRQHTNCTPIEYLTRCRLEHACSLLQREPARSITDIALACGFQTSQYFATVFARNFGRAPRAWRGDGNGERC
jgi:AraC family L-rhamnose operon regulatory protein RhaS